METDDERPPASPAETLRLIERERAEAGRKLTPHPLAFFGPWGAAWLIGFAVSFLRYGPDGRIFVPMPDWVPLVVLFTLLVAAAVSSGYLASLTFRHVHGDSSMQGAMYGFTWFFAFLGMGVTLSRFPDRLPEPEAGLLFATVAVGLTGALHMAGAAIWRDRVLFSLGIWITGINIIGTLAGPGWHSLIVSIAGGGAMLALGTLLWLRDRGAREAHR